MYTDLVYCTAPVVLRCAEREFGATKYRHAWGAADWGDLVRAFERATGRDLRA